MTRGLHFAWLIAVGVGLSNPAWALEDARPVVTLLGALKTADTLQPILRAAHAALEAAEARADEAYSPMLPHVSMGSGYAEGPQRSAFGNAGGNSFGANLSADQLLYAFGADMDKWRAAAFLSTAEVASERTARELAHLNVRTAYFAARAALVMAQVSERALTNQQHHLDEVTGFVAAGTRPSIDRVTVQRDVANARVQLINAKNSYELAKAQLNQAMGVESSADFDVANETMPMVAGEDQPLDPLMTEAQQNRPEFAAMRAQELSERLTIRAIKSGNMPSLHLATGLGEVGSQVHGMGATWDAGVTMSWPVFSGGVTQAQQHEAEANLASLVAQADALRQQVRLELERARLSVQAEKAAVVAASQSTRSAREQLSLAEGRYTAGVGSILEWGDAQLALVTAEAQEVQESFKLASARAQLIKALGRPD